MENEINKQRVSREKELPIGGGGEEGGVAVSQCCQARYTSPRLLHISRRGGEGEIDKRNIKIAAMTNYIGSKEEGRRAGEAGHGACS